MLIDQQAKLIVGIIAVALIAVLIGTAEAIAFKVALRRLDEVAARYPPLSRQEQQRELIRFRRNAVLAFCLIAIAMLVFATPAALQVALALPNEVDVVRWGSAAMVEVLALGWYAITMRLVYWIGRERILRRRLIE